MPYIPTCFKWSRILRTCVPSFFPPALCDFSFLLQCLTCLHFLRNLSALVLYVPRASSFFFRALHVLTFSCALRVLIFFRTFIFLPAYVSCLHMLITELTYVAYSSFFSFFEQKILISFNAEKNTSLFKRVDHILEREI